MNMIGQACLGHGRLYWPRPIILDLTTVTETSPCRLWRGCVSGRDGRFISAGMWSREFLKRQQVVFFKRIFRKVFGMVEERGAWRGMRRCALCDPSQSLTFGRRVIFGVESINR